VAFRDMLVDKLKMLAGNGPVHGRIHSARETRDFGSRSTEGATRALDSCGSNLTLGSRRSRIGGSATHFQFKSKDRSETGEVKK
jgi:hypothetical protein